MKKLAKKRKKSNKIGNISKTPDYAKIRRNNKIK